jgi:hypothetical protein
MTGIDVQVTEQGPTTFEVWLCSADGHTTRLPREHETVREIEELAFGQVMAREVRPLPAGAIRVRVPLDQRGEVPLFERSGGASWIDEAADLVARRILA